VGSVGSISILLNSLFIYLNKTAKNKKEKRENMKASLIYFSF